MTKGYLMALQKHCLCSNLYLRAWVAASFHVDCSPSGSTGILTSYSCRCWKKPPDTLSSLLLCTEAGPARAKYTKHMCCDRVVIVPFLSLGAVPGPHWNSIHGPEFTVLALYTHLLPVSPCKCYEFHGLILVCMDVMQAYLLGTTAAFCNCWLVPPWPSPLSVTLPEVGFLLLSVPSFRHDLSDLEKVDLAS